MRVLVVEDEPDLADTLRKALTEEDYAVDLATDGEEALFKITSIAYDVVILDVMLPRLDGLSVLRHARAQGIRTPILILTAREEIKDRVTGLNLGADDYVLKPFALSELIARLGALIRRSYGGDTPIIEIHGVTIDSAARRAFVDGVDVELTAREFAILEVLVRSRGRLVTRATLCEHVYTEDIAIGSNVVDVHIASLRRKLGADIIRTRRGEGYIVDA